MKTAIVHDLTLATGGADSTLQSIVAVYPSTIYTLVANQEGISRSPLKDQKFVTSFIQRLPWSKKRYRMYLPFYPLAVEQFNLDQYDVVLSSSFIVAKGAVTNTDQLHICYLHNPIRPAWELYQRFLSHSNSRRGIKGVFTRLVFHYLKLWDVISANRVDHFIANSHYTADRIRKLYRRESTVIYPPVDVDDFTLEETKDDYYVTASRLVYHKRIDLIIEAFRSMPTKRLVVVGDGPELDRLKKIAPANVTLTGHQPQANLITYIQKAKAFIFAAHEDFGISPIEAMACGTPVLAYGKGGCAETVLNGETGLLFTAQTAQAIVECVNVFESGEFFFNAAHISSYAGTFSRQRFESELHTFVEAKKQAFFGNKQTLQPQLSCR
ncbi:glycosyltransferase [Mucilaginibacter sp. JRF]|uniref:glycosyltransferase n=1 Tax=Mucilaginibacter sp. JRF TaxID=2780088 RepID=UPI001880A0B0|nr:glycosyltransferase [Mucilaginibacter sp. JRF]MBE9584296.1 glycosyltransferase [Mucilaginibacter sp. JRF]